MSIFASILRSVYKLSGAKKAFALPEDALQKEIEKQNRHRGVFTPTDRKAYYETIAAKSGCDKWHDYEMSVAPYETDKPIYYEFTACPAAEFAVRHGLTDIMPALCNVDFASMELLHARLVRTSTCVDGCRCDYTICGDKDSYLKEHPEYRDEAGFRRNK